MLLQDFLAQTQANVRSEIVEREAIPGNPYPYSESVFAEIVMEHMSEVGMTFEPVVCHYLSKMGNANLRLSGYAVSDEADQLDLFVSLYQGVDAITPIPDAETKSAAEQCLRFLASCANGRLAKTIDPAHDAHALAVTIEECYSNLEQIRIYVLTDRQAKSKNFKSREISGKTVKLEVMDIERLFRHWSEGKPRDELVLDFEDVAGGPLPCVYVPGETAGYDYALTIFPGEALRFAYEKFGARLLEANVRSFLSVTGKVNRGIRDTLKDDPEKFMAYNNGIVLIVDELDLGKTASGGPGIRWLKGLQIVNGGQTTASIYFAKKRSPEIDLQRVRIPAKIIILKSTNAADEESLVSNISKFANSQNTVKLSDLSANKPFHVEIEKLALSTYCPDGVGRWFYERAAGSYNVMLAREGATPARLRQLKESIPSTRKISKTDLARFINAWDQMPHVVSLGTQKNFEKFMGRFEEQDATLLVPDVAQYKKMIAKAILFKTAQKLIRPAFQSFQANVTAYTVSLVAYQLGSKIDLDQIWLEQRLHPSLANQIRTWASEVNKILHDTAGGRMVSEWAKRAECWDAVREATISTPEMDGA